MICGEGKPSFPEKSGVFFAPDLFAIALCDGGWSQKAYQIISPKWEYSVQEKQGILPTTRPFVLHSSLRSDGGSDLSDTSDKSDMSEASPSASRLSGQGVLVYSPLAASAARRASSIPERTARDSETGGRESSAA